MKFQHASQLLDMVSSVVDSESFEAALETALNFVLQELPFEAAAVIVYDKISETLMGYAGAGAFESRAALAKFVFPFSRSQPDLTQEYLIPRAFDTLLQSSLSRAANQQGSGPENDFYFYVDDVDKLASEEGLKILDVYRPGYKLRDFLALPLEAGRHADNSDGLLVLNNFDGSNNRDWAEYYQLYHESVMAMPRLVSLAIRHLSLRYEFEQTRSIMKLLRSKVSGFRVQEGHSVTAALEMSGRFIAEILASRLEADQAVLVLRDSLDFKILWVDDFMKERSVGESAPDQISSTQIAQLLSETRNPKHITLNGSTLSKSFLTLNLWSDGAEKSGLVLLLIRTAEPARHADTRFSEAFLSEDRRVGYYLEGEIKQWIDLILEGQRRVSETAEHWRNLAARTVHKLKSPISAIHDDTDSLLESIAGQGEYVTTSELTERLLQIVEKVRGLFERVMDFARFAGSETLHLEQVDVCDISRTSARQVFAATDAASWHLATPPAVPALMGDRRQLTAAITELLYNAKRHGSEDGVEMRIEVASGAVRGKRKDHEIQISITNAGEVRADLLEDRKLFEPFVTSDDRGTGIGLAYVRDVVRAHGGEVDIQSRGGSTTFLVRLPIAMPEESPNSA